MDKIELIKKFVNKINFYYPELYINFSYDEGLDEYEIWHNDPQLEFQDSEFKRIIGQIAQDILFDNNVYNFSFGYDHYKTKEIEKGKNEYSMRNTKINTFGIVYSNIDEAPNYSNNTNLEISDKPDKIVELSGHTIELCSTELYLANVITNLIYNNIFNIYDGEVA